MNLSKLGETESGKFFYNVLVGIVTSLIMDFSGNITNNLIIPLCMPVSKELVFKLKGKGKNKILVGRLLVFFIRTIIVYFILSIILKKIL